MEMHRERMKRALKSPSGPTALCCGPTWRRGLRMLTISQARLQMYFLWATALVKKKDQQNRTRRILYGVDGLITEGFKALGKDKKRSCPQ
jgi:hypothetical protein